MPHLPCQNKDQALPSFVGRLRGECSGLILVIRLDDRQLTRICATNSGETIAYDVVVQRLRKRCFAELGPSPEMRHRMVAFACGICPVAPTRSATAKEH